VLPTFFFNEGFVFNPWAQQRPQSGSSVPAGAFLPTPPYPSKIDLGFINLCTHPHPSLRCPSSLKNRNRRQSLSPSSQPPFLSTTRVTVCDLQRLERAAELGWGEALYRVENALWEDCLTGREKRRGGKGKERIPTLFSACFQHFSATSCPAPPFRPLPPKNINK